MWEGLSAAGWLENHLGWKCLGIIKRPVRYLKTKLRETPGRDEVHTVAPTIELNGLAVTLQP